MAKKKGKNRKSQTENFPSNEPWIPMRTGLIVIGVVSLGLAILTFWQTYGALTFSESLYYGLVRGGSIWVIFLGAYFLNRWLRGR